MIYHYGRKPTEDQRKQAYQIQLIVNRLVFGGTMHLHVRRIEIYHRRDLPPGESKKSPLTDGLRGMYDEKRKIVRICLRSFYGSFLWGLAHDLCHVHDLVSRNLTIESPTRVWWLGRLYTDKKLWSPGTTRATRRNYREFGGIFRPVIEAADQYVPWEVKPSVMAEVALMELRGLAGSYRVNREGVNAYR